MTDFLENHIGGDKCVIAFASGGDDFRHEVPSFEWKRTLDDSWLSYILMRDTSERWYEDGVDGIGNREEVIDWLRDRLARYSKKVGLGLSSGAYGALLFGQVVPFDEIIAISPLTMLGPVAVPRFEPRWAQRLGLPPTLKESLDLSQFYTYGARAIVKAFVSDGEGAELDADMARLIGIEPTMIPGHSHAGLAKHMKETGLIAQLLQEKTT